MPSRPATLEIAFKATLRREIIEQTLSSFRNNLIGEYPCKLIGNVDNIGIGTFQDMQDAISKYFCNNLVIWTPQPHSGRAYKTILDRCTADYVLMLEDDWLLLNKCELPLMLEIMTERPEIQSLRFVSLNIFNLDLNKLVYKHGYYRIPEDEYRFALTTNPTLFRGTFIHKLAQQFDGEHNLEKWMMCNDEIKKDGYFGIYDKGVVKDIGRAWREEHGYIKAPHDKNRGFTQWVKQ